MPRWYCSSTMRFTSASTLCFRASKAKAKTGPGGRGGPGRKITEMEQRRARKKKCFTVYRRESWDIGGAPPPIKSPRSMQSLPSIKSTALHQAMQRSADELRPMNGPPCCCPPRRRWPISGDIPSCITIVLATCKAADEQTRPTM